MLILCNGLLLQAQTKLDQPLVLQNWQFFPRQLLTPSEILKSSSISTLDIRSQSKEADYGTYVYEVALDSSMLPLDLALDMPGIYSSYKLWVNDELIGGIGTVGTQKEKTSPTVKPEVYFFATSDRKLKLTLQIADFHARGGLLGQIRLGRAGQILDEEYRVRWMDYALFTVLFVIAFCSFCCYYLIDAHRKVFLFFSFFNFAWLMKCLFANHYRIFDWVDLPWSVVVRVEYFSIILATLFAMLFVLELLPNDYGKSVRRTFLFGFLALTATFILPPRQFLQFSLVYAAFSTLAATYTFYVIAKAFINNRRGTSLLLFTMLLGTLAFAYAIISGVGIIAVNLTFFNIIFAVVGILNSVAVFNRINKMDKMQEAKTLTFEYFFPQESK